MTNKELEELLVIEVHKYLVRTSDDPALKLMNYKQAESFIKINSEILTDKAYKIKLKVNGIIGCIYDLNKKTEDGTSVRDIYNGMYNHKKSKEEALAGGFTKHFGWYIAKS